MKLPAEAIRWATSKQTLLQHAPLSLEARCKKIEDKYEIKIDPSTLWNYYRSAKIRFR